MFRDLPRGPRLLEIGPGTGQATVPLHRCGYDITAVELGAAMADVLRRKLPEIKVITAAFEEWPLPPEPFDLVVVATTFHWLDPEVRWRKAAAALRQSGSLAIMDTFHVAGADQDFWEASQACYERWDPDTPPGGIALPKPADVPDTPPDTDLFTAPVFRRHLREIPYTTAQYLDVLNTYSGHRALDPTGREGLLRCLAELVDSRFGGRIRKTYLFRLMLADRR